MNRPTEADIADLKAQALQASGRADIMTLELEDADLCVVVRSATAAEWKAYQDTAIQPGSLSDVRWNGVCRWALWPSRAELAEARERIAELPSQVCDAVEDLAGKTKPRTLKLSAETPDEDLIDFGIPVEAAREALKRFPQAGQLRAVRADDFACILKRPSTTTYESLQEASRSREGFTDACVNAAIDCVAWPEATEFSSVIAARPALPSLIFAPIIREMGGAFATVKKKRR